MRLAVAAFVKTPGCSPIKTRLAAEIGEAHALEFYRLAVAAVRGVMVSAQTAGVIEPYWAVAEAGREVAWTGFATIAQGEGDLGARLDRVYARLLADYGGVALIGADAPALTVSHFVQAREALAQGAAYVMGPARDGGFYLLAGAKPIDAAIWDSVPYSQADTGRRLVQALAGRGRLQELLPLGDVDTRADLMSLARDLAALGEPSEEQRALSSWLSRSFSSF